MKKLILLTAVMALALVPAMRAGDGKAKETPACCAAGKPDAGKCPAQGACCQATAKTSKESSKAAKQQAKAEKKAAQAEKKAAKKNQ